MSPREPFDFDVSGVDPETGYLRVEAITTQLVGWNMRAEIDDTGDEPEIMALSFIRRDHKHAGLPVVVGPNSRFAPDLLTARAIKTAPIGKFLAFAEAVLRRRGKGELPTPASARKRSTDYRHASIAAHYVAALGHSAPRQRVAERWNLTSAQVRDALNEARRRGLLTYPGEGRAGGRLTTKALEILNEEGGR